MSGEGSLQTQEASRLLQQLFALEVERRHSDIQHTEAQLRAALKELELVRAEEARQLEKRAARLQRQYEAAMAAVERRFLADAEALQARLQDDLQRETAASQAAIDARARELVGALGAPAAPSPARAFSSSPAIPSGATGVLPRPAGAGSSGSIASLSFAASPLVAAAAGAPQHQSPAARSPPRHVAQPVPSGPPPPAVAAATEAIAALRMQLPPSPAKLRAQQATCAVRAKGGSPGLAAIQLTATSGSAAAATARRAPGQPGLAAAQAPPRAAPPAAPSPPPKPSSLNVRFALPPAAGGTAAGSQGSQGGSSEGSEQGRLGGSGDGAAPQLEHSSSSEYEDESYWHNSSSSDAEQLTARAPPVKLVNPGGMTPRAGASRSASFIAARPSSAGSKPAVHLNLLPSPAAASNPGSPQLRTYSPCACREGGGGGAAAQALSPRGAAAGARAACCSLARSPAARTYTSD